MWMLITITILQNHNNKNYKMKYYNPSYSNVLQLAVILSYINSLSTLFKKYQQIQLEFKNLQFITIQ